MPDAAAPPPREAIRAAARADEGTVLRERIEACGLDAADRARIENRGVALVRRVRSESRPGLMETFLAEYGLSTQEGVALMCLAEALLRTPDAETIDALIEDKIAASDWSAHLGRATSPLVNASTWALMLTGRVLSDDEAPGPAGHLRNAIRRLGEPVIRTAVGQAMKELGRQFVLGRDIREALSNAAAEEKRGYLYSYDMLGEAARTDADARRYYDAYESAIAAIAPKATHPDPRFNPGISVKLSALDPRYEVAQRARVETTVAERLKALALKAKAANMQLNVDAEESERLELSLDVVEQVLSDPAFEGWDGFGVVIQAYAPRALPVIDWLHALAERLDRRVTCRLVKGAYWDAEIKRAQTLGLERFPVFTRKTATDVSYIACARRLMAMRDRIYPQFATHNAHTAAAVMELAGNRAKGFEFQRLHGMGGPLHEAVRAESGVPCRIYAPVGAHRDLLAYLVRRLLENGANSSFVHQIVDERVAPEAIAADPLAKAEASLPAPRHPAIVPGPDLFPGRRNSMGFDLADADDLAAIDAARAPFRAHRWRAAPLIDGPVAGAEPRAARNPADPEDVVGEVVDATAADVETAVAAATAAAPAWERLKPAERADVLRRAADLYEARFGELFALAAREAGKTLLDAVGELREAVDFLRYYAAEAERLADHGHPRGVMACVSPWNFPLAIFTGQIAAALAAGNAVLAKPAEQTPLMAARAVALMHEAGVRRGALQLLPGDGPTVGGPLTSDPRVAGVCFTGSLATAQAIHRGMAEHLPPSAPLIAETGGLNAMIVDSTALPEQAVRDILASAFQSAGQRCSALRVLYVQRDVAERLETMLFGAMDALRLGDPWALSTDVGPVIDAEARGGIEAHIARAAAEGRVAKRLAAPSKGCFVPPTVIRVSGIDALEEEVFGPVLHIATFEAADLERVVETVNARGYGLTFGVHSRIDDRVDAVVARARVGNLYVNRNQIGAIVGSQPFGGEGLSGTGPKAGGPRYLPRFRATRIPEPPAAEGRALSPSEVIEALAALPAPSAAPLETRTLPGPTGESNRYATFARGTVLCLGPGAEAAAEQARRARASGCAALACAPGAVEGLDGVAPPEALAAAPRLDAVVWQGDAASGRAYRRALAARAGPIVPLLTGDGLEDALVHERHVCVDTTAAGGNASLLAASGEA